jgi:hypothetical protein
MLARSGHRRDHSHRCRVKNKEALTNYVRAGRLRGEHFEEDTMNHRHLITLSLFLLSSSVFPVVAAAQQPDAKPSESQAQPQTTPIQPERTPQQSDAARQQDNRNAEGTRVNPDWTTRKREDDRADMDHPRRMDRNDQDQDHRTVGRDWRRDDEGFGHGSRYGSMDRDGGRYYDDRPRRRVKTCIEYENGDEFCQYRN